MNDDSKIKVIFSNNDATPEEPEATAAPEVEAPGPEAPEPVAEAPEPGPEEPPDEGLGFKVNDRRFTNLSEEELEQEEALPEVPSYVDELQTKLAEKDRQLREYIAAYKQEVGEGLERTKERLQRDSDLRVQRSRDKLVVPMLDVLDALERSVAAAESSDNPGALLDGVRMVQKLMVQKLEEMGLSRVPAAGQPFDPNLHEALAVGAVGDPAQDNMVLQEFKPGFALGDRVIRPAQVQVGKLKN